MTRAAPRPELRGNAEPGDTQGDPSGELRARHILVVDDVPMFRELESLFLARYGKVSTAASAAEALEIARLDPPEVLVADLQLPDLGGDELCRALRRLPGCAHCIPIVITGGDPKDHARAVRAGAADVLSKPLSRMALVGTVRRFLLHPDDPRGLPRVDVQVPVRLRDEAAERRGTARNVSRGGMFIECDWMPPEGTELQLEFNLPEIDHALSPTAELVWGRHVDEDGHHGQYGLGVRFLGLDGPSARDLDAFVHERLAPNPEASKGALA